MSSRMDFRLLGPNPAQGRASGIRLSTLRMPQHRTVVLLWGCQGTGTPCPSSALGTVESNLKASLIFACSFLGFGAVTQVDCTAAKLLIPSFLAALKALNPGTNDSLQTENLPSPAFDLGDKVIPPRQPLPEESPRIWHTMEHPLCKPLLPPAPAMLLSGCGIWQGEEMLVKLHLHKRDMVET